jgi:hypothetical protein
LATKRKRLHEAYSQAPARAGRGIDQVNTRAATITLDKSGANTAARLPARAQARKLS